MAPGEPRTHLAVVEAQYPLGPGFGGRLLLARTRKGVSRAKMAAALSIDPHSIYQYERGKTVPRYKTLLEMAEYLGVKPLWLLFGDDAPAHAGPSYATLDEFLSTPEGATASEADRQFLESYRGDGEPTTLAYHYLLLARRETMAANGVAEGRAEYRPRRKKASPANGAAKPAERHK